MASSSKSTGSAGLAAPTRAAPAPERTGREVTLITTDGAKYFVSPSIIKTSRALNGKMKDEQLAAAGRRGRAPWNRTLNLKDFTKECKELNGHTLEQIIEWAKHHKGLWTSKGAVPYVFTPWDEEFLGKIEEEDIYTLTLAATDLQIEGLVQLTCKKIAMMLEEGKTVEQVREEFGIVNDLTPEQEATIRLENLVLFGAGDTNKGDKGSSGAGGGEDKTIETVTSQQLQTQRAPEMPQLPSQQPNIQKERRSINIWSGLLEWHEKLEGPPDGQNVPRQVPCQVWANAINNQPEVNGDGWSGKLILKLIPKAIVGHLAGSYFLDVKTVLFMLQQCDTLALLTRAMESGFAGCVRFIGSGTGSLDIKVLILLYSKERCGFWGFIPHDQIGFVDRIHKINQQSKILRASLRQVQGHGEGGGFPGGAGVGIPPRMMGMGVGGQQLLSQQLQQPPQQLQGQQQLQPGQQQMELTQIEAPSLVLENVEKEETSTSTSSQLRQRRRRREKRQRLRQKREERKKKQEQEREAKHVHGQEEEKDQGENVGAVAAKPANDNEDDGEPKPRLIGDCLWEMIEVKVLELYRSRCPSFECLFAHIPQMESMCDAVYDRIMTIRASEASPPAPDKCDCKCHL